MSKRSKKARKHKQKHKEKKSFQPSAQAGAAEFLRAFKSAWNAGSWAEALSCYRSWTLRSGKQRQARLEAELLFRCASDFYRQGKVRVALEHLEEASTRDPERARRYPYYAGICLARLGELPQAQNRFSLAGDEFHRELLSSGGSPAAAFPEAVPGDPVFERGLLLRFWRRLLSEQEPEGPSTALSRIHRAYRLLCASGDPTPQLKLLEGKPGFQVLALHLRLLAAVAERSTVKVRNLVKANASLFASVGPAGEELQALLDIHLMLLLKEQNASEVIVLVELFSEADLKIAAPPLVLNEARFRLSLAETERGNLEAALELLEKVDATTPVILHNRALLLQRLGCYSQANEYWARLLKGEKKPKRSDPEDVRQAYTTTLRFIAGNARYEGKLQEAFSCLNEACALDEGDRQALEPLQQVVSELGRARGSLRLRPQALGAGPGQRGVPVYLPGRADEPARSAGRRPALPGGSEEVSGQPLLQLGPGPMLSAAGLVAAKRRSGGGCSAGRGGSPAGPKPSPAQVPGRSVASAGGKKRGGGEEVRSGAQGR
jgi:tetratricopeptide (TPR) repeat protein